MPQGFNHQAIEEIEIGFDLFEDRSFLHQGLHSKIFFSHFIDLTNLTQKCVA